ncbi:ATP-dependent DNA helicase [Rubrivivax benzoatilyticus]|uniref:AAA family ATPase n=1 Tax=Rubrivivax benzoatilyticus TaxID=316997 RepID=A0ABX0I0Z7_9BURK|nr:AAA family ATPase [Rubrivivax benzoatilyticus]EGJ09052.1 AAA ATPase [Rubrivivax benzoatilyticus JA2 = ATCC BAA-35]NHK99493.1 AAA family ATPase [Rubrivivax benzoatilyticus]NHL25367.1 AAA family ATPase [Rubrivivax benzoatilyticus]
MNDITLTPSQSRAMAAFRAFLDGDAECFLLKGSAGTGKTTLIRAMLAHLDATGRSARTLAPTGRAARILNAKIEASGHSAGTVHGELYALKTIHVHEQARDRNDPGLRFVFPLKDSESTDTVFIVDEASMVGDKETREDLYQFGSGRVLLDLVTYARLARHGRERREPRDPRIVLVGDPAQLPPVGDRQSPALSARYIEQTFGLRCEEHELTEVMRQAGDSAVLDRATTLRGAIARRDFNSFALPPAPGEIEHVAVGSAIGEVVQGLDAGSSVVLVTQANAAARDLNRAVRERRWGDEDRAPRVGDRLLVNKNAPLHDVRNGDIVGLLRLAAAPEVRHVPIRGVEQAVRLAFREVTLLCEHPDGSAREVDARILENLLDSPERELSPVEQRALLVDFRQRHPHLRPNTAEFGAALRQDPWFNALQVKYGYALTCHKAQGGEWDTAIVDFGGVGSGRRSEGFFRWAYTAVTRARRRLLLVSPPSFRAVSALRFVGAPAVAALPVAATPARTAPEPSAAVGIVGEPRVAGCTASVAASNEPAADPDWARFGFQAGQEPLFAHHRRLRDALAGVGVQVLRVQHGQYFERYLLGRDGAQAALQYYYKGDMRVSSVKAVPGSRADAVLLQTCLARCSEALLPGAAAPADADPFHDDFRSELQAALAGIGLRIVATEPGSYRLRCTIEGDGRRGRVDFHHDGRKRWTRATEVGAPGSSLGIFEQVRKALEMAS